MMVKLVDVAIQYDNPCDGKSYILVMQNSLHVLSMQHTLLQPFMLREAGIIIMNNLPKIQQYSPNVGDHVIIFPEMGLLIPLSLWNILSYFPMMKPKMMC